MKTIIRTDKEITAKISELCADNANFMEDNYGTASADEGFYEANFSISLAEGTLKNFVKWLHEEDKEI